MALRAGQYQRLPDRLDVRWAPADPWSNGHIAAASTPAHVFRMRIAATGYPGGGNAADEDGLTLAGQAPSG